MESVVYGFLFLIVSSIGKDGFYLEGRERIKFSF